MLRHNRLDLLSLATLIPALLEVQHDPVRYGADIRSLARHLGRCDQAAAAERLLEAHHPELKPAAALDLAQLKRRRGAWDEAVVIWERLANTLDAAMPALLALAKYHEHETDTAPHAKRRARLERRLNRIRQPRDQAR